MRNEKVSSKRSQPKPGLVFACGWSVLAMFSVMETVLWQRFGKNKGLFLFLLTFSFLATPCFALRPEEILVIANKNASKSTELAKYYMKKRGIPKKNLLKLWVTNKECCCRRDYQEEIVTPVRKYLEKNSHISCLVIMYGLPLKIAPPELTPAQKNQLENLNREKRRLVEQLKNEKAEEYENLKRKIEDIEKKITFFKEKHNSQRASLDAEIALVRIKDYPLYGWIPNPYFLGFRRKNLFIKRQQVLLVSRLDGPSDRVVKRIIDDSIKAEKDGLKGIAYFDARWEDPGDKRVRGYAFYDRSIHRAANLIKKKNIMPVVIDDKKELFQPGQCPKAALYCGWYSLSHYIDAFQWQPGSIGYHIASGECKTLKRKSSQVWCKKMLEKGITATIGPVSEPYVQAFPVPELFFSCLVNGHLTLAECYFVSLPYLSWQMVLIGDPLYMPFKNSSD